MSELTKRLREAEEENGMACHEDGSPDEAALRDLGYNYGYLHGQSADRIDKLEECLRDFLAEHDNAAIEQPDAKTLILYWARNNDMVTKARALLEDKP